MGDLDGDGDLDIVINVLGGRCLVLANQQVQGAWLIIDTVGTESNRDGIGALVRLQQDPPQTGMVTAGSGYLSCSDKRLHFGLGDQLVIPEMIVQWPSGRRQRITNIKANQVLRVVEPR